MSETIDLTTNDASIIIDQVADQAMGRPLRGYVPTPSAEDAGDVLTAGDDGTYSWEPVNALPDAEVGDAGKVLTLDNELDPVWSTPDKELPAGEAGDASKVLTLNAEVEPIWALIPRQLPDVTLPDDMGKVLTVGDSAIGWASVPNELPLAQLPGDQGKVLTVGQSGLEWAQPSGVDLYWHNVTFTTGSDYLKVAAFSIVTTTAADIDLNWIKDYINAGNKIILSQAYGYDGATAEYVPLVLFEHTTPTTFYNMQIFNKSTKTMSTLVMSWDSITMQSFGTDSHKIN